MRNAFGAKHILVNKSHCMGQNIQFVMNKGEKWRKQHPMIDIVINKSVLQKRTTKLKQDSLNIKVTIRNI